MAPIAIASTSQHQSALTNAPNLTNFPDGLKTSGQHAAIESLLYPYEEFPKEITGRTVWSRELQSRPEEWVHTFSPQEVQELGQAADRFIDSSEPLVAITKDRFPLQRLGPFFDKLKEELLDGRGFILFKGVPVEEWGTLKSAVAYLGLGTYFGHYVSQNGRGHILGHVQNLSEAQTDSKVPVRIYRTNKRQFFHTDSADLVGLLCMARSQDGGESDIASTHDIFNTLQREHPEVIQEFVKPNWWFDRKGELSAGDEPYYRSAVFFMEPNKDVASRRMFARFDPMNVTTLERYNTGPQAKIPPLTGAQLHAIKMLEETCLKRSLHMILEPGDIQLLSNMHVFHARTAYTDWPAGSVDELGRPRKQRQLMRLWLSNPESEGGWRTAWPDSLEKKRGGIQRDDQPPTCPLEAV